MRYFVYHCLVTDSRFWHNYCTQHHLWIDTCTHLALHSFKHPQQQREGAVHVLWKTFWSCQINHFLPELHIILSLLHTTPREGWCLTWQTPLCVRLYLKGTYYILERQDKQFIYCTTASIFWILQTISGNEHWVNTSLNGPE